MVSIVIYVVLVIYLIPLIIMLKNFTVVPLDEIHIISGKRIRIHDGSGRYLFFPFLQTRKILSKTSTTVRTSTSILDKLNKQVNLVYEGRVMITNPKVAAGNLSMANKESVENETNEIIRLTLKSKLSKLTRDDFKTQLSKISDTIFETSSEELEKMGIELSQFHIELN